jgi:hypothetical protein
MDISLYIMEEFLSQVKLANVRKHLKSRSTIFWDVMSCSLVEVYRSFERKYCLRPQCGSVSVAANSHAGSLIHFCFYYDLEDGNSMFI